jgi:hypothetical protein
VGPGIERLDDDRHERRLGPARQHRADRLAHGVVDDRLDIGEQPQQLGQAGVDARGDQEDGEEGGGHAW